VISLEHTHLVFKPASLVPIPFWFNSFLSQRKNFWKK